MNPVEVERDSKDILSFHHLKHTSPRAQEKVLGFLQFASVTVLLLKSKLEFMTGVWRSQGRVSLIPPV